MLRTRRQRPITYRDRRKRVWYVSKIARLKVVSPSIGERCSSRRDSGTGQRSRASRGPDRHGTALPNDEYHDPTRESSGHKSPLEAGNLGLRERCLPDGAADGLRMRHLARTSHRITRRGDASRADEARETVAREHGYQPKR